MRRESQNETEESTDKVCDKNNITYKWLHLQVLRMFQQNYDAIKFLVI